MSVWKSAHNSSNWCQSLLERANRDISTPRMRPTWSRLTSDTSRWKPARPSAVVADFPRSSSMTSTREGAQPQACARVVRPYCSRVDSWWSSTCWGVDWRTYTTANRSRCQDWIFSERHSAIAGSAFSERRSDGENAGDAGGSANANVAVIAGLHLLAVPRLLRVLSDTPGQLALQ